MTLIIKTYLNTDTLPILNPHDIDTLLQRYRYLTSTISILHQQQSSSCHALSYLENN